MPIAAPQSLFPNQIPNPQSPIPNVRHVIPTAYCSAARRGFTLVEMMIVLTIIAIVATMCIPTFQRAVEQSEADIAAANLARFGRPNDSTGSNTTPTPRI